MTEVWKPSGRQSEEQCGKQNLKQTTHSNTVLEGDVWVSRKLYSNVTIDANGFTPGYGNQRLNRPLRKRNPQGESQRSEWGREEHSTHDAPNRRMTKHRAKENMTSVHSAKETVKWQLTEDETPAKTANPSLRSRMNTLSTHRVATSQRAKEWRTIGSLRSKPRRKSQSRVHHKSETLPKVQNSQLKMRVSPNFAWPRTYTQHSLESQWRPHRENSKLTGCRDL